MLGTRKDPLAARLNADVARHIRSFVYGFHAARHERPTRCVYLYTFEFKYVAEAELIYEHARTQWDPHSLRWMSFCPTLNANSDRGFVHVSFSLDPERHFVEFHAMRWLGWMRHIDYLSVDPDLELFVRHFCTEENNSTAVEFVEFLGFVANHSFKNVASLACTLCERRAMGGLARRWPLALDFLDHVRTMMWTPDVQKLVGNQLGRLIYRVTHDESTFVWWETYAVLLAQFYAPAIASATVELCQLQTALLQTDPDVQMGHAYPYLFA